MMELKQKPKCCGKEMDYHSGCQSLVHTNQAEIQEWVCLECGHYIQLAEDDMDEEDLQNYKENYGGGN